MPRSFIRRSSISSCSCSAASARSSWTVLDFLLAGRPGRLLGCTQRDHGAGGGRRITESRPPIHEVAALIEQVATPIGGLYPVADRVGQRHFDNVVRNIGLLG